MIIDKVEKINSKYFRFCVYLSNTAKFEIGSKKVKTYIDGASEEEKKKYWNKILSNYPKSLFMDNFIHSQVLFTSYLLWGNSRNLKENIIYFNFIFNKISY